MSDKELLAQIAAVAGAINKHMNTPASQGYPTYNSYNPYAVRGGYGGAGRGRGRGGAFVPPVGSFHRKLTLTNTLTNNSSSGAFTPSSATSTRAASTPVIATVAKPFVRPPVTSRHLSLINNTNNNANATNNTAATVAGSTIAASSLKPSTTSTPSSATSTPSLTPAASPAPQQQHWIQSNRKNMSLMNPAVYKKTMEAKQKSIRSSKEKKLQLRQALAKLASDRSKGIVTMGDGHQYNKSRDGRKLVMRDTTKDNIVINGVAFEMDPRGNKLVRKTGTTTASPTTALSAASALALNSKNISLESMMPSGATPKQFSMGGVDYVRTRSGNLVRATLVKNQLLEKRAAHEALKLRRKQAAVPKKTRAFCKFFTRFGQCQRGPTCPFVHSRTHLAICKKFLRGACPKSAAICQLSHNPSPHTTPACSHFQRAACNKDNCLYPHIRINPKAPICRPFATEGWCEAGANCKDRHVWICPDFDTPAGCKKKCGLAHVTNGGVRVKRSAEEMEKERQDENSNYNINKRKRLDATKGLGRYMDDRQRPIELEQHQKGSGSGSGSKKVQYDENFVPFDLGEDGDEQMDQDVIEQEERGVMDDFEGNQEVDEEEEEEDVSSDVDEDQEEEESEVGEEDDDEEDDDEEDDDEGDTNATEMDSAEEDEDEDALRGELERYYEEQDREDDGYY